MTHAIAINGIVKFKYDSIQAALLANRQIGGAIVRKCRITSRWVYIDPRDAS